MKPNTSRIALILLLATLLTTLGSSCRTFRGFGRDVQHVGGHIERASHR
jgi:predicted small secreted protein